jgi:hypothetical protein
VAKFKVLSWHYPGETDKNHENSRSEWPMSKPRFESKSSRIFSRIVNHSATTFYAVLKVKPRGGYDNVLFDQSSRTPRGAVT